MRKKPIRAIVVEDERLPRLSLLQKLEDFKEQIEVVDSCDNYSSALNSILRHKPKLLFLDIQLQGRNAMNLIEELKSSINMPYVIFTTAYEEREYLMKAIKIQAVDYLIKPIDRGELALAIEKVVQLSVIEQNSFERNGGTIGKLLFRTANGQAFIHIDDIIYAYADGNYSVIVTKHDHVMVLENLVSLERKLDNHQYIRADRKHIINLRHVYKINVKTNTCIIQTDDGFNKELHLSKNGIETLLDAIR